MMTETYWATVKDKTLVLVKLPPKRIKPKGTGYRYTRRDRTTVDFSAEQIAVMDAGLAEVINNAHIKATHPKE